jgi:hypothetical protein
VRDAVTVLLRLGLVGTNGTLALPDPRPAAHRRARVGWCPARTALAVPAPPYFAKIRVPLGTKTTRTVSPTSNSLGT